jgi:hypothetical protein
MAEGCFGPGVQKSGMEAPEKRQGRVANRVDTPMDAVEPTSSNPARDGLLGKPAAAELVDIDHPELAPSYLRQPNCVAGLSLTGSNATQFGHGRHGGRQNRTISAASVPPYLPV